MGARRVKRGTTPRVKASVRAGQIDRLVTKIGSIAGVARRLGVSASTVAAWRAKGIPKAPKPPEVILRPGDEETVYAAVVATSFAAVGKATGITPEKLKKYMVEGIPAPEPTPREKVAELEQDVREQLKRSKQEEKTFYELLKAAKHVSDDDTKAADAQIEVAKKNLERALKTKDIEEIRTAKRILREAKSNRARAHFIPDVKRHEGVRSGKLTAGYQWTEGFRRILNPALIAAIEAWILARPKKSGYDLWQATAYMAQYAIESRKQFKVGSPPVVVVRQTDHPKYGDFAANFSMSTRSGSRSAVVKDLHRQLTAITDDKLLVSFIYSVRVVNYRRRGVVEQREFAARQRREAEKKALRAAKHEARKQRAKKASKRVAKKVSKHTTKKVTKRR